MDDINGTFIFILYTVFRDGISGMAKNIYN